MFVYTVKLHQVVFGHWDVVTCLTRSETYIGGDCYFVSGSRDATLMLWYWSGRKNLIVGDAASAGTYQTLKVNMSKNTKVPVKVHIKKTRLLYLGKLRCSN